MGGMIISSDDILKEQQEIWPDFEWEIPKNPYFTPMPDEHLKRVIKACSIKHMVNIPGIWECENYSGRWQSNVEVFQYELFQSGEYRPDPQYRWYISDIFGIASKTFGGKGNHSKNLIRLEKGTAHNGKLWVLFEPQTDTVSTDYESFYPVTGEA